MTVSVPREAAGLAGVAWATFALHSGLVPGGSAMSVGNALAMFRELYNDNRSAVVAGLEALSIISASEAEATLPRTLSPASTMRDVDIVAMALSMYPVVELARLTAASRLPSSQQGESLATTEAPNFGTHAELLELFRATPTSEAGVRAWFANFTRVWPRGSSDPYAQNLWSFANNIASSREPGPILERAFTTYVFMGGTDPYAVSATALQQAARVTGGDASVMPTGGTITAPPAIELDPTVITARASGRSIWFWFVIAAAFASMGGMAWYVWSYRRRTPWRRA